MIDLKNLDRWAEIVPGKTYELAGRNSRVVTVTVRSERKTPIYLVGVKSGEVVFLANIDGYGKIKFRTPAGHYALCGGQDGSIYLTTVEMEKASVENVGSVIFTKVVERRARDPRFEEMMFRMQQNLERRLLQVRNEDNDALESRRKTIVDQARQAAKDEQAEADAQAEAEGEKANDNIAEGAGKHAKGPKADNGGSGGDGKTGEVVKATGAKAG